MTFWTHLLYRPMCVWANFSVVVRPLWHAEVKSKRYRQTSFVIKRTFAPCQLYLAYKHRTYVHRKAIINNNNNNNNSDVCILKRLSKSDIHYSIIYCKNKTKRAQYQGCWLLYYGSFMSIIGYVWIIISFQKDVKSCRNWNGSLIEIYIVITLKCTWPAGRTWIPGCISLNSITSICCGRVCQQVGVVVNMLYSINTVALHRPGYYLDGWLSADRQTISVCNQPHGSTQPSIRPG